jgi:hypothetical protein
MNILAIRVKEMTESNPELKNAVDPLTSARQQIEDHRKSGR